MTDNRKNTSAVILAGGSGTRFWPVSRKKQPKQFVNIIGKKSLFQETIKRVSGLVDKASVYVVTSTDHKKIVQEQIKGLGVKKSNILFEPQAKNTAPAICYAAQVIKERNPEGIMVVLPSDHLIQNGRVFERCVNKAVDLAKQKFLVTMGIVPTSPHTGYGYLKLAKRPLKGSVYVVEKFTEKPSLKKAQEFLKTKRYLWNAGMFVWKVESILKAFERYLPKVHREMSRISKKKIQHIYQNIPSISVDYGILEKAGNIVSVPGRNMRWSDLGDWQAFWKILDKDKKGNVLKGNVIHCDGNGNLIFGKTRLIAAAGLEDIVIVDTPDALLVCPRNMAQKVRDIVDLVKKKDRNLI